MIEMEPVQNAYAVVMAGGRGERFWPESRLSRPKQFLDLLSGKSMIEQTVDRLLPLFCPDHILVITHERYAGIVRELLPDLPEQNILPEPAARDTAPCIALAAAQAERFARERGEQDPVLCVVPSDHVIQETAAFCQVLRDGCCLARFEPCIVTVGIRPTFPCTGYGYIRIGDRLESPIRLETEMYRGLEFREKPDESTAEAYLKSGCYRWNGGMFMMACSTLVQAFRKEAPEMYAFYERLVSCFRNADGEKEIHLERFRKVYETAPRISIDYAVMEKVSCLVVADCSFSWDDLGSWPSLRNHVNQDENGNAVLGLCVCEDSRNCIIDNSNDRHLVAVLGMENTVIVHTEDATLVCSEKSAQKIKKLLSLLSEDDDLKRFL